LPTALGDDVFCPKLTVALSFWVISTLMVDNILVF